MDSVVEAQGRSDGDSKTHKLRSSLSNGYRKESIFSPPDSTQPTIPQPKTSRDEDLPVPAAVDLEGKGARQSPATPIALPSPVVAPTAPKLQVNASSVSQLSLKLICYPHLKIKRVL